MIAHLEQPDDLCKELRALGARHRDYGVVIDQYAPVGSALIWMFQHTLGDRFTSEMEEAWRRPTLSSALRWSVALGMRLRRVPKPIESDSKNSKLANWFSAAPPTQNEIIAELSIKSPCITRDEHEPANCDPRLFLKPTFESIANTIVQLFCLYCSDLIVTEHPSEST